MVWDHISARLAEDARTIWDKKCVNMIQDAAIPPPHEIIAKMT
jgi:hypothetical protein